MSTNYIESLKEELALAEKAAQPVLVETVTTNHDEQVTTIARGTDCTTRRDHLGGEKEQYYDRPVVRVEVPLVEKAVPVEVGKVIQVDETKRTIELVSGTVRTDLK